MKTVDLQPILDAVHNIEKNELTQALIAHGGSFDFEKEQPDYLIGIEYYDEFGGPSSADVCKVEYNPNNNAIIITVTDDESNTYDINDEDVYPGHLSVITDALPEPAKAQPPAKATRIIRRTRARASAFPSEEGNP